MTLSSGTSQIILEPSLGSERLPSFSQAVCFHSGRLPRRILLTGENIPEQVNLWDGSRTLSQREFFTSEENSGPRKFVITATGVSTDAEFVKFGVNNVVDVQNNITLQLTVHFIIQ